MTMLTRADLAAMGRVVVDGVAVKMADTAIPKKPASAFKSKWEAERADMLEVRRRAGSLKWWRYEPMRLRLADGAWYKPDFLVQHNDGSLELEEIKGHWREAALVRFKVARELYPMFHFNALTKREGEWRHAL